MVETGLGIKAAQLIFTGACLGIGFWASKRITRRIDRWLDKQEVEHSIEAELARLRKENEKIGEV